MTLPLDDFDLLATPADLLAGAPLKLPITSIDEDPDQPRHEFDPDGLAELAETIKARGVRQPISVRRHPAQPDRWMLNFGARRLRASKLAGQAEIPAFVDNSADSYDQVIENEQRESLKSLELALFVQRRMTVGESQAEIARRLGKSRSYVTVICALIDAPDWLMDLYRSGRCRGITELYELRKLHEAHPDAVEHWLVTQPQVARANLQAFRDGLKQGETVRPDSLVSSGGVDAVPKDIISSAVPPAAGMRATAQPSSAMAEVLPDTPAPRRRALALVGEVDGVTACVLLDATPADGGQVFVVDSDSTLRRVVAIGSVERLRLEER